MNKFSVPDPQNQFLAPHAICLLRSFRHWTGRDLLSVPPDPEEAAKSLWTAPFVVASNGPEADPVLNYGNQSALKLWEMPWEKFVETPSRFTAEPMHRDERARFLETVRRNGFIDDYQGIRISSSGKRFRIEQAIVWNLLDEAGRYCGQAATFSNWTYL